MRGCENQVEKNSSSNGLHKSLKSELEIDKLNPLHVKLDSHISSSKAWILCWGKQKGDGKKMFHSHVEKKFLNSINSQIVADLCKEYFYVNSNFPTWNC